MFSWITGSGVFKQDDFDDDKDALTEFYHSRAIWILKSRTWKLEHPMPDTMVVRYYIFEGRQYKVGAITFHGRDVAGDQRVRLDFKLGPAPKARAGIFGLAPAKDLNNNFTMKTGATFTPGGMTRTRRPSRIFTDAWATLTWRRAKAGVWLAFRT